MSPLLEVKQVSRSFSGLRVLHNVSFAVETGRITGLIGPNGAGKSTLFNIVSGFLTPDTGQILYQGRDVNRMSVAQRSRVGLVRTFQTPQVFANLTVRENIVAGCYKQTASGVTAGLLGTPGVRAELRRMHAAADSACERFSLTQVSDQLAGKLPAGQQRLVELARACVAQPKLLCLDEPSSGLNSEEVARLMQTLTRLSEEGLTILLVSHDMDLVAVAAVIHVLCFGEIIASGALTQVQSDARVRDAYLGT
jgi:ABC-type branched-subunit amino acid transport system ATPase component